VALAQAPSPGDQTERPSAAVCQVLFDSDNVGVGLTMCLIEDKATFLDQSTHTECQDHDNGTMTTHTIFVSVGAGSVKVWGVSVRTGVVSNPSEFGKTCEDIPFMPFLISGHPLLEDGLS
jgi:hypothetical protein